MVSMKPCHVLEPSPSIACTSASARTQCSSSIERTGGATHWRTAIPASAEGAALAGLGRYAEAEKVLAPAYKILTTDIGASKTYAALAQRYMDDLNRREALATKPRKAAVASAPH